MEIRIKRLSLCALFVAMGIILPLVFHLTGIPSAGQVFLPMHIPVLLCALVLGHTYTCFLRFRGGKGVATSAGCLFALSPVVGTVAVAAWVLCMVLTRYVSLSSMVAGLVMLGAAVWEFAVRPERVSASGWLLVAVLALIFVLVVFKHRANIVRLCRGTEPKAFSKK